VEGGSEQPESWWGISQINNSKTAFFLLFVTNLLKNIVINFTTNAFSEMARNLLHSKTIQLVGSCGLGGEAFSKVFRT